MDSNENFHIIENLGLIIVSHNDILNQESIETIVSGLLGNPFFKYKYNLLLDVRSSVFKKTTEEVELLGDFIYINLKEIGIKKFALLTTVPKTNIEAELIRHSKLSSGYQVSSSVNAALNWLGIPNKRKPQVKIVLTYLEENYVCQLN